MNRSTRQRRKAVRAQEHFKPFPDEHLINVQQSPGDYVPGFWKTLCSRNIFVAALVGFGKKTIDREQRLIRELAGIELARRRQAGNH